MRADVLRYINDIKIHVTLQDGATDGTIYVPYIDVTYSQVRASSYGQNIKVQVKYKLFTKNFSSHLKIGLVGAN